ncbi:predicted protein [Naegleria gruberi]|uniref:Predicted protein n=1 Tax=Naegleria gruberi TaxID=5762 RepID=D2V6L5_NAEGR|nr:uncharacterized protein NAEGRDRAFT_78800 [Naegleria gruberi]EFC47462.1 predicted protein [Naegleria gruberi]|eukprot:XP_002680206.1 predicted protein [Naegleria gruberi strain NEG-M]
MSKRKGTSQSSNKLSKVNAIILSLFYIAMLLVGIITVIVFVVVKNYAPAWILLSAAVMIYLLTFVIGFAFYGVKILIQLRGSKGSLLEYKFTKFILYETALFIIGWLVSLFMLTTYIFGYDSMTLFWGLNRNIFMDCSLNAVLILSSYITFNDTAFVLVYGKKALSIVSFIGTCGRSYSKAKNAKAQEKPLEETQTESKDPQTSTPTI